MAAKLVIFEGMDNTGKSTTISKFKAYLERLKHTVCVLHMNKPPDVSKETGLPLTYTQKNELQKKEYDDMLNNLISLKKGKQYDYIILDRSWISEYVYGQLYRGRSADDIINENLYIETILLNTYKLQNIFLVYLYPTSVDFVKKNEDEKSLAYLKNKDNKAMYSAYVSNEYKLFDEAVNELTLLPIIPIVINNDIDNFKRNILTNIVRDIVLS